MTRFSLLFFFSLLAIHPALCAQDLQENEVSFMPSEPFSAEQVSGAEPAAAPVPGRALLRSFVLPGWGQYYANSSDWRRGQYHLGAELALIGSWIYLQANEQLLEGNMYAHASAFANINLRAASRQVEIAAGAYNSLAEYNEAQLRNRNWNQLIDDVPGNRWNWASENDRIEYRQLRDRRDRAGQQVSGIITVMVVNRVVSGIHAFIQARDRAEMLSGVDVGMRPPGLSRGEGYQATLSVQF
ncbi:MAG: hypothetical protein ACOC2C_05065 [Cyclonatronaceae bacterium]